MLRALLLILSGNVFSSALMLVRNLVVARLISVEDYGIAATFAIAMTVVEMGSQLGLKQQIVQAANGDDPRFQAALQGFQVLRGVLAGGILFAIGPWIARFFGVPELTWAYQLVAVIPVLYALQHFDIHRLNRQMRFGPMVLTNTVPAALSLLAVWPLAAWFGDYRVMLYALVLHALINAAMSHLVSERAYRLVLDRGVMGGSLRFGWPLLVNGLLLFAVFQGDKLIVGRELGLAALAVFAMGLTLTLTPTLIMAKTIQQMFLPVLSRHVATRDTAPQAFESRAHAMLQAALLNGTLLALVVWLIGPPVVHLLLGEKYAAVLPLLIWFALTQGLRVFKSGPAVVALACGKTGNAMAANLVRVACLPLAWWAVVNGGDLVTVLWIAIVAEALGFVLALVLVQVQINLSLRPIALSLGFAALFLLALALGTYWPAQGLWGQLALWGPLALFAAMVLSMGDLRRHALRRHKS